MRGFIFTMDVIFASLLVILTLIALSTTTNSASTSDITLQLAAKDATFAWFFGGVISNPTIVPPQEYACDVGFRPIITTQLLDPASSNSWVQQKSCVVKP